MLKKLIILIIVLAGLGAGGYFGLQKWTYLQSPQYLEDRLKLALQPGNEMQLAPLAEFDVIFDELTNAVMKHFPHVEQGKPDRKEIILRRIRDAVLERLRGTDKIPQGYDPDEDRRTLQKILIMPQDFIDQILQKMQLKTSEKDKAGILTFAITHPQLENKEFTFKFSLQKHKGDWHIMRFSNADELVRKFREAHLKRQEAKRKVHAKRNNEARETMNTSLPISSCSAETGMLSDKFTILTVIRIKGHNRSQLTVNNVNLITTINDKRGKEIWSNHLNAVIQIEPGQDMDHIWTLDSDRNEDLGKAMLANGPFTCKTRWYAMGLGQRMYYDVDQIDVPEDIQ